MGLGFAKTGSIGVKQSVLVGRAGNWHGGNRGGGGRRRRKWVLENREEKEKEKEEISSCGEDEEVVRKVFGYGGFVISFWW